MDLLYLFLAIVLISTTFTIATFLIMFICMYCENGTPDLKRIEVTDNPLLKNNTTNLFLYNYLLYNT